MLDLYPAWRSTAKSRKDPSSDIVHACALLHLCLEQNIPLPARPSREGDKREEEVRGEKKAAG